MTEFDGGIRHSRISYRIGNIIENRIGEDISSRFEAPLLKGDPVPKIWYRIPLDEGIAGDGSEYHIYLKKADPEKLCVFFSGGGVAWNAYTAARPVTGGKVAAGLPNYYWSNLRPFTQIMNIHTGITESSNPSNPFDDWSFVIVTYATGDFHVGDQDFRYENEDGEDSVLHFHGFRNFLAAMEQSVGFFPEPRKLLIAGDSAGAFAVPALADEVLTRCYPACRDVTLLSDSALLLNDRWQETARDVWGAPERFREPLTGNNITLDWYRSLYAKYGGRLRYLYASSIRDYLLSGYYNDLNNNEFRTGRDVQEIFYRQTRQMVKELKELTPEFGICLYSWHNHRFMLGGTVHTAVRHKRFYQTGQGTSMADWLADAVNGKVYDVGMALLGLQKLRKTKSML